jgi:DNA invertase Pin-like site-specific DNA recombinase
MIYGYARVSTDGQTLEGQCAELRKAGVEKVYSEKISGAVRIGQRRKGNRCAW